MVLDQVLNNLHYWRAILPGYLRDYLDLNLSEMIHKVARHLGVKLQEAVHQAPEIEGLDVHLPHNLVGMS